MFTTTEASYHLASNGVPSRCYEARPSTRHFGSMDEAFGLDKDEAFDLVF